VTAGYLMAQGKFGREGFLGRTSYLAGVRTEKTDTSGAGWVLVRANARSTVAQQLADSGLLSDALVGSHHTRHLLTQCVGRGDVEVEVHHFPLQHGDRLVLSTDGLTDGVEDPEIERVCSEGDCEQACQQLLERGLAAGGRDNITVIVADVDIVP